MTPAVPAPPPMIAPMAAPLPPPAITPMIAPIPEAPPTLAASSFVESRPLTPPSGSTLPTLSDPIGTISIKTACSSAVRLSDVLICSNVSWSSATPFTLPGRLTCDTRPSTVAPAYSAGSVTRASKRSPRCVAWLKVVSGVPTRNCVGWYC